MSDEPDHVWLLAREAGQSVDHVERAKRDRYAALERTIAAMPDPLPPPGWQGDVLAAVDASVRRGRSARVVWAVGAFAAAALVALWLVRRPAPDVVAIQDRIDVEVRHGASAHRGEDAAVGDVLVIRAQGRGLIVLRVYRDRGAAIAACPGDAGCRDGVLELAITAPGTLRVVAFYDRAPPPAADSLDEDLAAASRAGARTVTAPPTAVR